MCWVGTRIVFIPDLRLLQPPQGAGDIDAYRLIPEWRERKPDRTRSGSLQVHKLPPHACFPRRRSRVRCKLLFDAEARLGALLVLVAGGTAHPDAAGDLAIDHDRQTAGR